MGQIVALTRLVLEDNRFHDRAAMVEHYPTWALRCLSKPEVSAGQRVVRVEDVVFLGWFKEPIYLGVSLFFRTPPTWWFLFGFLAKHTQKRDGLKKKSSVPHVPRDPSQLPLPPKPPDAKNGSDVPEWRSKPKRGLSVGAVQGWFNGKAKVDWGVPQI